MDHHSTIALPNGRTVDLIGVALAVALAGWALFGAAGDGSRPGPFVALIIGCAATLAVGRRLADREPLVVHRLVALGVAGALVFTAPGLLRAGGAPLGYANANATLAGLAVLAATGVVTAERDRRSRTAWCALTAGLVVAVVVAGSVASAGCLAVAAVLLGASAVLRRPAVILLGGAIGVAIALGLTVAISHGADPAGLGERAAERAELWTAAADLTAEHPMRGIGVGRFAVVNPVSNDADLRWAHHEYLQTAAETGLIGLALVLSLLGWAYARLALAASAAPHRAMLGGAAVTLVALHSTVDHVLHHPALLLTTAALVGATTVARPAAAPGAVSARLHG